MKLYNGRNTIIRLFENKCLTPSVYAYNGKSEPKEHDEVEKSEQKFAENIAEGVKLKRQKSNELNKIITKNGKIISKELFKNYFLILKVYLI